jgi:hypothetical protein
MVGQLLDEDEANQEIKKTGKTGNLGILSLEALVKD